jgi:alkylated DNA repair protein (DNA oxidative demethylase)
MGGSAPAHAYGHDAARRRHPDTALINFYGDHARLGMHQDKDEVAN